MEKICFLGLFLIFIFGCKTPKNTQTVQNNPDKQTQTKPAEQEQIVEPISPDSSYALLLSQNWQLIAQIRPQPNGSERLEFSNGGIYRFERKQISLQQGCNYCQIGVRVEKETQQISLQQPNAQPECQRKGCQGSSNDNDLSQPNQDGIWQLQTMRYQLEPDGNLLISGQQPVPSSFILRPLGKK